jgi:hypothetical protein
MITRTKCYRLVPGTGCCQEPITHWWIGIANDKKEFREQQFNKGDGWLIGFCEEHTDKRPTNQGYDWKRLSTDEFEVYKIMGS